MRKYLSLLLLLYISVLVLATPAAHQSDYAEQELPQHLADMAMLYKKLDLWVEQAESLEKEGHQELFRACRKIYKHQNFWVTALEPSAEKIFNGANLPSATHDEVARTTEPPSGFQVIEELIYTEDATIDNSRLKQELNLLSGLLRGYVSRNGKAKLTEYEVCSALRNSWVYLYTLGITGFDSPIALESIEEASWHVAGLQEVVCKLFLQDAATTKLLKALRRSQVFLETSHSFDAFDRLEFYKRYWQPTYAEMMIFKKGKSINEFSKALVSNNPQAISDSSVHLFGANFLKKEFFLNQPIAGYTKAQTVQWVAVGRMLFNDKRFSADGKTSCATCHHKEFAFAENLAVSKGLERNSPSLTYAALQQNQFWDMRIAHLEEQPEHVILNKKEFATTYASIMEKLKQQPQYTSAFSALMPNTPQAINPQSIGTALAYYISSLATFSSPFDDYMIGKTPKIHADIRAGYNLFTGKAKCATCHFAPVFNGTIPPHFMDTESEVLGVLEHENFSQPKLDKDRGRGGRNMIDIHLHSFKTPTVRNVELTGPYMHNGSIKHLDSVIAFYNYGGGVGMGLALENQTLPADSLKLTPTERQQLVSFMLSLTDKR